MRTAAVKPVFHSLLMVYWHLPATATLLLELLAMLDELFELATELLIKELLTLDDFELELTTRLLELLLLMLDATLLELLAPTIP